MKHNEDPIDVLRKLGHVKPREGMEARILARVAARRQDDQPGNCRESFWRTAFPWRGALALATVAVVLLAFGISFAHQRSEANQYVEVAKLPTNTPSVESATETTTAPQPAPRHAATSYPVAPHVHPKSLPVTVAPLLEQPLTEQERLLLKFAAMQKNSRSPNLGGIVLKEVVEDHGLGRDALLELSHQNFHPIHYTQPGETE